MNPITLLNICQIWHEIYERRYKRLMNQKSAQLAGISVTNEHDCGKLLVPRILSLQQ